MNTRWILFPLLLGLLTVQSRAEQSRLHKEIPSQGEKRLVVNLEVGAATMKLGSHAGAPLVRVDILHAAGKAPLISYKHNGTEGRLTITSKQDDQKGFSILGSGKKGVAKDAWTISISRDLPCVLDVGFGLGSGTADFGGLNIEELTFATGLSEVELNFSIPCQGTARKVELATGLGSMEVKGLSNLKMNALSFAGGMGSALLDFSGKYRQNLNVELDVGMGSLSLKVPESMGVKVRHDDNFLSSHEFDRLERSSNNTWYSSNWREVPGNLSFELSVGMGSVDLEWIAEKRKK